MKTGWFKRCVKGIVAFWNSEWIGIGGSAFISVYSTVHYGIIPGIGWAFAALWMYAWKSEKCFYNELLDLYRRHLDSCEKQGEELKKLKTEKKNFNGNG